MLMSNEEYADYANIMEEEAYKDTIANKRETWQETACIPARAKINMGDTKKGDILRPSGSIKRQYRKALTESDGPAPQGRNNTCHLCKNDSSGPAGYVCVNPAHLYWGSRSDNEMDKPAEMRATGGKSVCAVEKTCPHCGKVGKGNLMSRWHFDNCKWKDKK